MLTVFGGAAPASASAPNQACSLLYNARITFWAMTCSEPGEPMIGAFATWRNEPLVFDHTDTGSATVQASNYLRVTPNTSSSPDGPNIEIGLYAQKTGRTTNSYGPRWTELTNSGGRTKAITAGVDPNKPNKRNHTYMTVRQDHGNQWDVLYDFNKVGSTTSQLKVLGGATNRIDVGLEVTGPQYIDVPAISNRMQYMTGNKVWERVATRNVARSVTLPACSSSSRPPNCFTTKLTDGTNFAQWTVSKPRQHAVALAAPAAANTSLPATFNGVDQQALQSCMDDDPDTCLASVPGLAECVTTARICNAAALQHDATADDTTTDADVTAAGIRDQAAAAFDVPADDLTVAPPVLSAGPRISRSEGDSSSDGAWAVTSTHSTPGLHPTDQRFDGFTARYSARTGALLEACWGDLCDAS
ncbi:hypothetical protein [Streptomyces aureus]|uniref:hypothetical protein n=1 Tax=Streptomyces aureus TaxID=193461 RepID=UPI001FD7E52D|nr:hypothetical protein [Streptomyces aureus]